MESGDPFAPINFVLSSLRECRICPGTISLLMSVTGEPESAKAKYWFSKIWIFMYDLLPFVMPLLLGGCLSPFVTDLDPGVTGLVGMGFLNC